MGFCRLTARGEPEGNPRHDPPSQAHVLVDSLGMPVIRAEAWHQAAPTCLHRPLGVGRRVASCADGPSKCRSRPMFHKSSVPMPPPLPTRRPKTPASTALLRRKRRTKRLLTEQTEHGDTTVSRMSADRSMDERSDVLPDRQEDASLMLIRIRMDLIPQEVRGRCLSDPNGRNRLLFYLH